MFAQPSFDWSFNAGITICKSKANWIRQRTNKSSPLTIYGNTIIEPDSAFIQNCRIKKEKEKAAAAQRTSEMTVVNHKYKGIRYWTIE